MKVKTEKKCKNCWKEFKLFSTTDKFCKKGCMLEFEANKKRKVKEKKKCSISSLSKVADVLWSKYIRLRAWKCEYCWKTENLNAHHIFTRHSKNTRWDIMNWISLCPSHHTFSDEFSAHKTPVEFTYWLEEKRWKEFINDLRKIANTPMKVTPEYLQDRIEYFKEMISILETKN